MSTHAQFEQLCVLATSGQLSAAESALLNEHLRECGACSSFFKDVHALSDTVISRFLPPPRREVEAPHGMRERFLARAAAQGFAIGDGAPFPLMVTADDDPAAPRSQHASQRIATSAGAWLFTLRRWITSPQHGYAFFAATCLCIVSFALGSLWPRNASNTTQRAAAPAQTSPAAPTRSLIARNAALETSIQTITAQRDELAMQYQTLLHELDLVTRQKHAMESASRQQIADSTEDHDSLAQQVAALHEREVSLRKDLDTLRLKQSTTEATLIVQQRETRDYAARLNTLRTQLDSQSAAPQAGADEVRNLVAARNLHIIDVYDADATGNRQRAFGRVFYVEGRSLIFYAYDLTKLRSHKSITFHVWGERADRAETTHSLGILSDDDANEHRWSMTFDDPKVLAEINSVFVTVEPANRDVVAPTGKKVLYAFLGAKPNHP